MRNLLTLAALLLSTTGIFVSLAREELRCRLGLSSTACVATDQAPVNPDGSRVSADSQGTSPTHDRNGAQPDPQSSLPSTAKLMETMDQLREKVTPQADPGAAPEETAPPAQPGSQSQDSPPAMPNVPMTSRENAVDTAIIGDPAPPKTVLDTAPIAPPAEKVESYAQPISVTPAQGTAIPVTPPDQE